MLIDFKDEDFESKIKNEDVVKKITGLLGIKDPAFF